MPRNVEIKAAVDDLAAIRERALAHGASAEWTATQVDRYYAVDRAGERRVKLRTGDPGGPQLIEYRRPESDVTRVSEYTVIPTVEDPPELRDRKPVLTVRKRRELLLYENVRIHLDRVEDLGCFVELEAVLAEDADEAASRRLVDELVAVLALDRRRMLTASYSDLLARGGEESKEE